MTVAAVPRDARPPAEQLLASEAVRARAGGENFSVASLFVGRATAERLLAIYDYARLVDELGDAASGDRLRLLDEAEAELDRAFAGRATAPIFRALEPFIRDCSPPRDPFLRLIEANRRDQLQPGDRRPIPSSWTTATSPRIPSASSSCTCSTRRHPSGSGSPTRSAPACSSSSTGRTLPRTHATGASTSRATTESGSG